MKNAQCEKVGGPSNFGFAPAQKRPTRLLIVWLNKRGHMPSERP